MEKDEKICSTNIRSLSIHITLINKELSIQYVSSFPIPNWTIMIKAFNAYYTQSCYTSYVQEGSPVSELLPDLLPRILGFLTVLSELLSGINHEGVEIVKEEDKIIILGKGD